MTASITQRGLQTWPQRERESELETNTLKACGRISRAQYALHVRIICARDFLSNSLSEYDCSHGYVC